MHQTIDRSPLLTVREVAAVLRVSSRLVWRLIAAGELERVSVGRCARVTPESIEGLIQRGGTR